MANILETTEDNAWHIYVHPKNITAYVRVGKVGRGDEVLGHNLDYESIDLLIGALKRTRKILKENGVV